LLRGDADALPPRALTPTFFGAFDWHSAVHGHWSLVRALRWGLAGETATHARATLAEHVTRERIEREAAYLGAAERAGFERPYGLAWLLQLAAELREWRDPSAARWLDALEPLESLAVERWSAWLPRLSWPIRSGEHSQTAFAMGVALDWARTAGNREFAEMLTRRAREFHGRDRNAPVPYEPSGHDFLSPVLGSADLMRRVLEPEEFASWLAGLLPDLHDDAARSWLVPVTSTDRADGKLAHLDGLNLSRAWMLEGIVSALSADHPHRATLDAAAASHRQAGLLAARETAEYAGTHWLGSYAIYLLTERGISAAR
jgi:hypothetical protein